MNNPIGLRLSTIIGAAFAMATQASKSAVIHESATLGPTGQYGGLWIGDHCFGSRFHLDAPVEVQGIGGHIFGLSGPLSGPIFGALVPLNSPSAFPSGDPSTMLTIATVTFTPSPPPSEDILVPLSASLQPGDYALIFGGYRFGATGEGAMTQNNINIPGRASYFSWGHPDLETNIGLWYNSPEDESGYRFVVTGIVVPEPSAFQLLVFALAPVAVMEWHNRRKIHV